MGTKLDISKDIRRIIALALVWQQIQVYFTIIPLREYWGKCKKIESYKISVTTSKRTIVFIVKTTTIIQVSSIFERICHSVED